MDTLDSLLEQLCSGDSDAAERVFLAYEPYLRMVVRRMLPAKLRPKFDSVDVVQSIWADVLVGFREAGWRFSNSGHLKAFLVKATRNRFLDRFRQQRTALAREQSIDGSELAHPSDQPEPIASAQAEELWKLMQSMCPPQHQQLLELKRQGHSLEEISAATGLHPSSIRRILYDLAKRLAFSNEEE